MRTFHSDHLGQASGYNGAVMRDTKQQIFRCIDKILAQLSAYKYKP